MKVPANHMIINGLKSQATLGLKLLMGIALVLVVIFLLSLIYEIAMQQYRIRHYTVTTEAKILQSTIVKKYSRHGKYGGYHYKPQITYSYEAIGQKYTSSNITVINSNHSDEEWAKEIVAKYPPGKIVTAYFNPANPQKSFLIYEIAFWPYNYFLFGFVALSVCTMMYFAIGKIYKKHKSSISGDYFVLWPDNIKKVIRTVVIICLLFYVLEIILGAFYYSVAFKPYDLLSKVVFGVYSLTGFIILGICVYYTLKFRTFESPNFFINQSQLQAGKKVRVKVIQKFKVAVNMVNTEMALVCTTYYKNKGKGGKDYIRTQDCNVSNSLLCKERNFLPGEFLEYEDDIIMPNNVHKSGFSGKKGEYPFYRWYFSITNSYANGPDFTTRYFVSCE